jgi:hypothetical protein
MQVPPLIKENKEIVAAVIGGTLAIIAAYIRRDKSKSKRSRPILTGFVRCLVALVLGAGCLVAEFKFFPVHSDDDEFNPENIGEVLILAGCVLLCAGIIWGFVNFCRMLFGGKPPIADALPA